MLLGKKDKESRSRIQYVASGEYVSELIHDLDEGQRQISALEGTSGCQIPIKRGSYIGDHVLLNLLNELGKRDKMQGLQSIYLFFATSLINSIIQEHKC